MPTLMLGLGPWMVRLLMLTVAAVLTSTRTFSPKASGVSGFGAWMIAPAPLPWSVRFLLIVTCSVYVPGLIRTVSPGLAALTAVWMEPPGLTMTGAGTVRSSSISRRGMKDGMRGRPEGWTLLFPIGNHQVSDMRCPLSVCLKNTVEGEATPVIDRANAVQLT